jgi:predicted enzyme related to lactoylglutathione lyase
MTKLNVREMFFSVPVTDMDRARQFYVGALDGSVLYQSSVWSSLQIAGVRLGLNATPSDAGSHMGLHFVVDDLAAACDAVVRAGGVVVSQPREVRPGVILAEAADTEGNVFTLSLASDD